MTRNQCALARYSSLLINYSLTRCFVPSFKHLDGADINRLDGGETTDITLSSYSKESLSSVDELVVDYDDRLINLGLYKEVIANAVEMGKDVFLTRQMKIALRKVINAWPTVLPLEEDPEEDMLYEISVPVVTVLTQGMRTDQFAIELALNNHFSEEGYNVSQICSCSYGKFLGLTDMPDFIYEPRHAYEKIIRFNHFVKQLVDDENPDLIIISVPEAVMKYSNKMLQGLGVLPFVISNAIQSDITIFDLYFDKYNEKYFDELTHFAKYRLSCPVHFFNLSNTLIIPSESDRTAKIEYVDINSKFVFKGVEDDIEQGKYRLFNILDSRSAKQLCICVQDTLIKNVRSLL